MPNSILSTSNINSLVTAFRNSEMSKRITPLNLQKNRYTQLSSSYGMLSSKLDSLKSALSNILKTGDESIFIPGKTAQTSNDKFVTATADKTASLINTTLRVNQLAKHDMFVSQSYESQGVFALSGTHTFSFMAGNGSNGNLTSSVTVTLDEGETYHTALSKMREAILADKVNVNSTVKDAATPYSGGESTITFDVNGTETEIALTGGGTYEELIDELVSKINNDVNGVTAEKIVSEEGVSFRIINQELSNYLSISHKDGFNVVSDFEISTDKKIAASGMINTSVFSPQSGESQISFSAKQSGLDFRLKNIEDSDGTLLAALGLNTGSIRNEFNQSENSSGFLYNDISSNNNLLNAKIAFNGMSIQRNANVFSNLIEGVEFNLKSVMQQSDVDVNITLENDYSPIKEKIENFVTKFNDTYQYIRNNSRGGTQRGVFLGDASASSVLTMLNSVMFREVEGLTDTSLNSLSKLGLSFNVDSGLQIDSEKLDSNLKNNLSSIEALFNSSSGIATLLENSIAPYLGATGYLATSRNSLGNTLTYLNDRISSSQKRIDKSAETLRKQYQAMQIQLAQMLSFQSFFMGGDSGGYF